MSHPTFDTSLKSERLREILRQNLVESELQPGDRLPSEPELIARYGVSRSTVREAVAALAQEGLLYRAQGKGTFVAVPKPIHPTIAVVLPFLFFSETIPLGAGTDVMPRLMQAIEGEARRVGANISLYLDNHLPELERANVQNLRERGVQGVLLNPIAAGANGDVYAQVRAAGIPLVFVDGYPMDDREADFVVTDNAEGAYRTTRLLIAQGYERVIYVTSPVTNSSLRDRRIGYERAVTEAGFVADVREIEEREADAIGADRVSEEERGYRLATDSLLPDSNDSRPFAIFAADAPILAGVWRAVEEQGAVDDRVAFACFDEPFLRFPPAVYAVKILQPFAEIGPTKRRDFAETHGGET